MIQIHTFCDEHGRPRAELPPPYELLGWFLETEVGIDLLLATRIIADIDSALAAPGTVVEGRAQQSRYWLGESARLRYREIDPPQEVEVSLMGLRFVVDRWRALIQTV